jgi:CheY-like chemotaxis protein
MSVVWAPILLVEDNPNDVLLFQRAYNKAQVTHPLQIVSDGQAAIDYLSGQGIYSDRLHYPIPAVVLLDLKLPRRSGHEVLAWIRQHPYLRRLPVVIFTSSNQATDINRAYDLATNSYLVKPVSNTALTDLVRLIDQYWLRYNEKPTM